jgi:hypothetical protein
LELSGCIRNDINRIKSAPHVSGDFATGTFPSAKPIPKPASGTFSLLQKLHNGVKVRRSDLHVAVIAVFLFLFLVNNSLVLNRLGGSVRKSGAAGAAASSESPALRFAVLLADTERELRNRGK